MTNIAIIGAGIAGLTLARQLRNHATVTVFEKSRGYGGRMATRSAGPYAFDHGAQFFTAKSPEFRALVAEWKELGIVRSWNARFVEFDRDRIIATRDWDDEYPHYVGVTGMNRIGKQLAADADVRLDTPVAPLEAAGDRWQLETTHGENLGQFDWVISTAPAAQTAALLPATFAHHATVRKARMLGCYALMLGFPQKPAMEWDAALIHNADISWISVNSSKPERPGAPSILVHSTNAYAETHMDDDPESVEAHLLREFHAVTGIDTHAAEHRALHRWRYANMPQQSGEVALLDTNQRLGACGDWLIRGRIEAAFISAATLAQSLRQKLQQAG